MAGNTTANANAKAQFVFLQSLDGKVVLVSAICNEGSHQKPQFLDPASIISMLKDAC